MTEEVRMPTVGDLDIPQLAVIPFDGTTAASVTVLKPDGTTTSSTPATTSNGGANWAAPTVALSQPGWWVYLWTVTGTGAGSEPQRIWVAPNPTAGGPVWTPSRAKVGALVPGRTVVGAVDGYGNPLGVFDDTTHPTGTQVDSLIADAVAWVLVKAGAVDSTLAEMATATAATYVAAAVERAYPDSNRDVSVAAALWAQAVSMRDDLARANEQITGEDPGDPTAHLVPTGSFPRPVPWGDQDFL